ncbi:hypothetical protein E4191_10110 [Paracoccus liaowanqingii]|uniref:Uncharacterized protein n=1 Tax=Paracoccus liaowanqingii TaxID=2560053 RepID=A0A4V1BJ46_9RHOB|nr:hypothetical protein [Paracoccus liaowanqingii]QBX35022.2 hypothetical protein E4191_10110 [Paracoccus liaowanqingii]
MRGRAMADEPTSRMATAGNRWFRHLGAPVTTARKILRRRLTFAVPAPASWGHLTSEINTAAATAVWLRVA